MQQFSAWLSKQHGGSSFHFHYSKVLPEFVLKQIWETSVFVKQSHGFKSQNSAVILKKPDLHTQLLNSVHVCLMCEKCVVPFERI